MTVLKPCRVGVVVGFFGSLVHLGCSDDDTPLDGPTVHADAGASSSVPVVSSGPGSSSSGGSAAERSDAGTPTAASTTEPEITSSSDASTDVQVADGDAGEEPVVGLLEGLSLDPETTIFAQLIVRAEMQADLDKEGPFTVLAPINSGFERLPEGYLDSLTRKQVETLVRNHLIFEQQSTADLIALGSFFSVLELEHEAAFVGRDIYIDGLTRMTGRNQRFQGNTVHKVDSVLTVQVFPGTLAEAVHAYPRLSELEGRLNEQDRALLEQDDKTLFAPINGGFGLLDTAESDAGTGDAGAGLSAVSYHVLPHKVAREALGSDRVVRTAFGPYLSVSTAGGLMIGDGESATRLVADLEVQSGDEGSVLHVVEVALVAPPSVDEVLAGSIDGETFATLRARLDEVTVPGGSESFLAHVRDTDGVTVFAPTDAAFNRIAGNFGVNLGKVLGFHVMDQLVDTMQVEASPNDLPITLSTSAVNTFDVVVGPDAPLVIDGLAAITFRDVPAANGVVHVIDAVLVPQDVAFPGTTVQALAAYPTLSKVSDAVAQTGLLDGVTSTLFAPHDWAFDDVGSATVFVEAHTVTPWMRDRLTFGTQVFTTISGDPIDVDAETLMIDDVRIVRPDLLTQSGVVHILDGKLATSAAADAGN